MYDWHFALNRNSDSPYKCDPEKMISQQINLKMWKTWDSFLIWMFYLAVVGMSGGPVYQYDEETKQSTVVGIISGRGVYNPGENNEQNGKLWNFSSMTKLCSHYQPTQPQSLFTLRIDSELVCYCSPKNALSSKPQIAFGYECSLHPWEVHTELFCYSR